MASQLCCRAVAGTASCAVVIALALVLRDHGRGRGQPLRGSSLAEHPRVAVGFDQLGFEEPALPVLAEVEEIDLTCLGFDACPSYPPPYPHGQWPVGYPTTGEFPDGFVWGLGTSAYQVEGAYRQDGRGASIWDTFTGADTVGMPGADCSYCCKQAPCPVNPGMVHKGATGSVACDHYNMWKADVALMKSMGLQHYRFSISWPRLIPTGRASDGVNEKAKAFYNDLIDALLEAGIAPFVTLYHWDLPQGLLDPPRANGWWSRDELGRPSGEILPEWLAYAEICFSTFGDRVKHWVTFNEPWTSAFLASGFGAAPGIDAFNDQSTDPYIAAHNVLNAHAAAVDLYRRRFQPKQSGKIGITNNCDWREPNSSSPEDIAAAERAILFQLGWFADPIFGGTGDYPRPMRKLLGDKLPRFTEEQRQLINGSSDFFGLNHYSTGWASVDLLNPGPDSSYADISEDGFVKAQSSWLFSSAWGFRKMLSWVKRRYNNPPIFVTESGWSLEAESADDGRSDQERVLFYANYSSQMLAAIVEDGVDVRGFFAWSLVDNFEWSQGYEERFGVTYVDFAFGGDQKARMLGDEQQPMEGNQIRVRKDSSCWWEEVWRTNSLVDPNAKGLSWGCADASIFHGKFLDLEDPGCTQHLDVQKGVVRGEGKPTRCRWGPRNVSITGSTVAMQKDRTQVVVGYWNHAKRAIEWGSGAVWGLAPNELVDVDAATQGLSGPDDDSDCPGFDSSRCPQFPAPFEDRKYPESYEYAGEFPHDFIWGLGTASYQIEGGYREGGRGASIWDTYSGADTVGMPGSNCSYCCKRAPCEANPGMASKGATGNVACDHFNQWRSDVALMKSMGLKHYRFSVSWPRVVPTGRKADGVEEKGIKFYSDLVDALLEQGITPYVTLYHWDLPQGLLDPPRVNGWWSRDENGKPNGEILQDWLDYVDIVFDALGDRVKYWVTFNEPWTFTYLGSGYGKAPGIPEFSDMTIDPYISAHNVLNAHAAAVHLYRTKYQMSQGGKIGITNNCDWREPKTDDPADVAAALRVVTFQLGWFAEAIFGGKGDYPPEMRKLYGDRLPNFTDEQRRLINGSSDFFGLNHYGSAWAQSDPNPHPDMTYAEVSFDGFVQGGSSWLYGSGWGFRKLLNWIHRRYPSYPIIVTEGGWSAKQNDPGVEARDRQRVLYYANYTASMHKAINEDGVDVRGYFAWSFMDNFEWEQGYLERFGVTFTDYMLGQDPNAPDEDGAMSQPTAGSQTRIRKDSSCWLEEVWRSNRLVDPSNFAGCALPDSFTGLYVDEAQTGCLWNISRAQGSNALLQPTDTGSGEGCTSPALNAQLSGTTVITHDTQGRLTGYLNSKTKAIEWGSGKVWTRLEGDSSDYKVKVFLS